MITPHGMLCPFPHWVVFESQWCTSTGPDGQWVCRFATGISYSRSSRGGGVMTLPVLSNVVGAGWPLLAGSRQRTVGRRD